MAAARIQPNKDAEFVVGIDLGGTNVRSAVVSRDEKIVARHEVPSDAQSGVHLTIKRITESVHGAIEQAGVAKENIGAVGIAVPGHIDVPAGMVVWAPNFGETKGEGFIPYKQVPLRDLVEAELGLAMTMDNDANTAAVGEFRYGAGRGSRHLVMFTLGTGIGGGIIVEGEVLRGATGGAAEVGHIIIADGVGGSRTGAHGRLEGLAQRDAIIERAALKMESGRSTLLWDEIDGPEALTLHLSPSKIDAAALKGDALAIEVLEETGHLVGVGIASMINVFNPEIFVLGGKISRSETLYQAAIRTAKAMSIGSIFAAAKIVRAELGDDAGIMGAAELAWRETGRTS